MKSLSPELQAHLDEGTTTLAWCWRITRADGVTFGFTDHDRTLSFDETDFEPESGLTASEVRSGSDLSVDAQDAEGVLTSDRITETDILDGRWDNAEVEVWRVNWADPSQRVLMRRGAIGQIRRGRLAFVAEVRSLAHVLGQTIGRTFQATCDAALGDARCGAKPVDFNVRRCATAGTVPSLDAGRAAPRAHRACALQDSSKRPLPTGAPRLAIRPRSAGLARAAFSACAVRAADWIWGGACGAPVRARAHRLHALCRRPRSGAGLVRHPRDLLRQAAARRARRAASIARAATRAARPRVRNAPG